MEPLGAVASALTLVEALGQTSNAVRKISRRIKNAPQDLESLEVSLELLRQCIERMRPLSYDLGPEVTARIGASLRLAGTILASLDQACDRQHIQSKTLSRLNWALLDGSKMEAQLAQLRNVQATLQSFLQIIGFERQVKADLELFAVRELILDLSNEIKTMKPQTESETPPEYRSKELVRKTDESHRMTSNKIISADWLKRLGSYYSLLAIHPGSTSPSNACSNYSLGFHLHLPFSARSVVGQISLTRHLLSNSISFASPSNISLQRLVAGDSNGFVACLSGDLETLKRHLKSGAATLEDVTAKNWTLMTAAILGGNVEMVQFLLDNGMGVNTTFGQSQTSYIQWALDKKQYNVARCLLSNKADVNYVSLLGWNALFYCWPKAGMGMEARSEEVEFLSRHDYLDVDLVDRWGWTVLQRLAAYGIAIDVQNLIQLGASLQHLHMPFGWPAIFHAAYWGNLDTFIELLKHYPEDIIRTEDVRGWTLLHVAASAGREEIARLLLSIGANPRAVSRPSFEMMPESIQGLCCTPSEVAAAQGPERLQKFEDVLAEFPFDEDDDEEGGSEFVDALEKMPLLEEVTFLEKAALFDI